MMTLGLFSLQQAKAQTIVNPSFEKGTTGWTIESMQTQGNSEFQVKDGNVYIEKWITKGSRVGNASAKQVIKDLPFGKYRLTAGAQNLNQNSTSQKCTGAYIFANDERTEVYTPDNYSVEFVNTSGEAVIGFEAVNASGNWIAVDNFRLEFVEEIDKALIISFIKTAVEKAETLVGKMMSNKASKYLNDAIVIGKDMTTESMDDELFIAVTDLNRSIAEAEISIAEYKELADAIEKHSASYDASKNEAEAFKSALDHATALSTDGEATSEQLSAEIKALEKAAFAFNLANATEGTGTAVKVTATNHHVVTGVTEALMRATMTGSNILERGVCWSTEHNPTVLDERSTKYMVLNGNIYHVRGLNAATVYYLRPYVMNKTYQVAYGDEVKIVTHPRGTCRGTWDETAPDEAANKRCREAIQQTIDYFNEWTGIRGFVLSGHYGAQTPTADCSYGGWMRIGPNQGNQAIGTVIHETGHGVGVGTSDRWRDTNVHNWKWYGREANRIYTFLENKEANPYTSDFCLVGDTQHGWGSGATYDWWVNGADKDKHIELQYIGGCALLYGLFVDGLNPTTGYTNGLSSYTYNFDENKKYYIMNKDAERGLGSGMLFQYSTTGIGWQNTIMSEEVSESAAWYIEYNPSTCFYSFRNAQTGNYLTYSSSGKYMQAKSATAPSITEYFQLMPDRTDVTIGSGSAAIKTHGYWFTWSKDGLKAMGANAYNALIDRGTVPMVDFNYSDKATQQQWIIISEDELEAYRNAYISTAIHDVTIEKNSGNETPEAYYTISGIRTDKPSKGVNIIRYANGKTKKVLVK